MRDPGLAGSEKANVQEAVMPVGEPHKLGSVFATLHEGHWRKRFLLKTSKNWTSE